MGNRIYARDFFGRGSRMDVKYMETLPEDVLVFDAAGGEYVLGQSDDGCGLDIDAAVVEVIGDVVIRAYPDSVKGADQSKIAKTGPDGKSGGDGTDDRNGGKGRQGEIGAEGFEGGSGQSAERIKLKIGSIIGNGTLRIINHGCPGGRGGEGGKGGDGGRGGRGDGRACNNVWGSGAASPGNGGPGGPGGMGGRGGRGGTGGDGGPIEYSYSLQQYIDGGKLVLSASGGAGGPGGPGGLGGDKGRGGGAGSGAACGGGGTTGIDGLSREKIRSKGGEEGLPGKSIEPNCYNRPAPNGN